MSKPSKTLTTEQLLADYRLVVRSRQMSLMARQEVLNGRAKFGGFGDGKELPLMAMAHYFQPGDFRSGYYRDQTLLLALGDITIESYFAQLYAHASPEHDTSSAGRQMPTHFATHSLDEKGEWRNLTNQTNTSADLSPTASQMPRLVGLAQASKLYREVEELHHLTQFSKKGNEVAFGVIGNASCAEGLFWESINAIGVLQVPAVIMIMDDEFGISVPNSIQFTKPNLSEQLSGYGRNDQNQGFNLYTVKGWQYDSLLDTFSEAVGQARANHVPAILHVTELTQPQGHSTSGSHERYKTAERLAWEETYDCLTQMRHWLLREEFCSEQMLLEIEDEEKTAVREKVRSAWRAYKKDINQELTHASKLLSDVADQSQHKAQIHELIQQMNKATVPRRRPLMEAIFQTLKLTRNEVIEAKRPLINYRNQQAEQYQTLYSSHVVSQSSNSPLVQTPIYPSYTAEPQETTGFDLLNRYFDDQFGQDPRVVTFGEDVGYLGGVNQTMAGLQEKYGANRVSDTGIREATIAGQGIGLALRGLRPIAEIQYLDYLPYAIQILADDLATLHWRTAGRQKAPLIVRTRGHRLEGVWHAGSLMAGIIHMVRGMHVIVPRDMTRAIGFYNTLLKGDDPAIVVEALLAYRQKEPLPTNLFEVSLPLGVPEIIREGRDITIVTYGTMCQIVLETAVSLAEVGIEAEVIDVQTLLPFDRHGVIVESLMKTNRVLFTDEDVPGGTTAFMMQQVLEEQGGYHWLDSEPITLTSQPHRPAYGTDGAYFSKPNVEGLFTAVYNLMHEVNPAKYPLWY